MTKKQCAELLYGYTSDEYKQTLDDAFPPEQYGESVKCNHIMNPHCFREGIRLKWYAEISATP